MAEFMNGEGGEYQRQKVYEDHIIPTDPNQPHHQGVAHSNLGDFING